jgi:hypothetical protein
LPGLALSHNSPYSQVAEIIGVRHYIWLVNDLFSIYREKKRRIRGNRIGERVKANQRCYVR